jgi:hypothetical protein
VEPLGWRLAVNSGYRCSEDNRIHNRQTTNHHGKAIDILDAPSKMIDMKNCDQLRGLLVEKANAQIGWGARNRRTLEPPNIAPTSVQYDVRIYDALYSADSYFVKTLQALNVPPT